MAGAKETAPDPQGERRLVDLIRRGGEIPDSDIREIIRLGDRLPERDKACSATLEQVQALEERRMSYLRSHEKEGVELQRKLASARAGMELSAACKDWLLTRAPRELVLEVDTCECEERQHTGRLKDAEMRLREIAANLQEVQGLRKRGKAEQDQLDAVKKEWEGARDRVKGIQDDIANARNNIEDAKARVRDAVAQFRKKALASAAHAGT